VVDTASELSHFRCFIDDVYKVYSMSAKNQSELQAIADSMSAELLKYRKFLTFGGHFRHMFL